MLSVASDPREGDSLRSTQRKVNLVMAPFLAAMRRLLPPLKVKWKLLASMIVLALYCLLVWLAVRIERLPRIDWGAEAAILNGLVLSFLEVSAT